MKNLDIVNGVAATPPVRVLGLLNPVNPHDRQEATLPWRQGMKLSEVRPSGLPDVPGLEVAVSVNGRSVSWMEQVCYILQPGDFVLFKAKPRDGGDGSKILGAVASLALMLTAPQLSTMMLGETLAGEALIGELTYGAALGGVIALGGSAIINMALPMARVDVPSIGSTGLEDSATYSWNVEDNPTRAGSAVPVASGHCKSVTPFLLTYFVTTDGEKQILNALYVLSDGTLDEEDPVTNIQLNDNPISNYDGFTHEIRRGVQDQSVISWFNDTINQRAVSSKLSHETWSTMTTNGNNLEALGLCLTAPSGLFESAEGGLAPVTVQVEIEYRAYGETEWTAWKTVSLTGESRRVVRKYQRLNGLASGQYEMRCKFVEEPPTGDLISSDVYWEYMDEIVPDDFAYPNTALLGIQGIATDQFSGTRPKLTCDIKRTTTQVWNPTTGEWEDKPLSNMAWIAYEASLNRRFGAGAPKEAIRYSDFKIAADWNDTKGISGSFYVDSQMTVRDLWDHVGLFGRFNVVETGVEIRVITDKPVDLPEQGFVATAANIIKGSFGIEYLESANRADAVEVTYWDPDSGRKPVLVLSDHFHEITDRQPNVASVTLFPCNDLTLAIQAGRYYLNCNKYLTRDISHTVSIDAIGCEAGDVIQVANDRVGWGQSSRLVSCTSATATLSRAVTLEPELDYWLVLTHRDQVHPETMAELKEVVPLEAVEETTATATVVLAESWESERLYGKLPTPDAVCAVCSADASARIIRWYKIHDIDRKSRLSRTIKALEYFAEVHDDDGEIPVIDASKLFVMTAGLSGGVFERSEDGLDKRVVSLFWRGAALEWQIFRRRAGQPWRWNGSSRLPAFDVTNLEVGFVYEFAVTHTHNPGDGKVVVVDYTLDAPSGIYQDLYIEIEGVEVALYTEVDGVETQMKTVV